MATSYPTSLQALATPGAGAYQDDPGLELDVVVTTTNDTVLALQTKLGTGASVAAANQVLRGTGTGASAFGQVATGDITAGAVTQRLQTGVFSGTRTAATYADVDSTNGKLTMTTVGGDLFAIWVGYASNSSAAVVQHVALRIDAAAEVASVSVYSLPGAAGYPIPFCVAYLFTGVSTASHSVYARHINDSAIGTMTTAGYLTLIEIKK